MLNPLSSTQMQTVAISAVTSSTTSKSKEIEPESPKDRAELNFGQGDNPDPKAGTFTKTPTDESQQSKPENTSTTEAPSQQASQPENAQTPDLGPGLMQEVEVSSDLVDGIPPEMVVQTRRGELLDQGKILKVDQYPTLQNEKLTERIEGAPNFRQIKDTEIYGVSQPTIEGIRNVLDRAGAKDREVHWNNMREEPVLYIDGRSYNLRELGKPFENSEEFEGLNAEEIEETERRLKSELLAEAEKFGGRILLHDEDENGVVAKWVQLTPESVQTTREVFDQIADEGYQVDFARVPVTDEKAPETQDLEALVERVSKADPNTPMIFNCHAGRGRTTTAMVAAQLVQDAQKGEPGSHFSKRTTVRQDIREQGDYEMGEYRLILRTIQALEHGVASKDKTDEILDRTDEMQNLRTAIARYREKSLDPSNDEGSRSRAEGRGLDYLHRYHTLITFNAYLNDHAKDGFKVPYGEWLQSKPELQSMLDHIELAYQRPPTSEGGAMVA